MSAVPAQLTSFSPFAVWLLTWAKSLVAFVTIKTPKLLYSIVSYSMTLTVRCALPASTHVVPSVFLFISVINFNDFNDFPLLQLGFWNFFALFILSAIALNYLIRFRYLDDYKKLNEPPLEKPDVNELHPDVNTTSV